MLEEVGAPYRIVPIDFEKGEHKSARISGAQSDGQAADHRPSRHGGDRDRRRSSPIWRTLSPQRASRRPSGDPGAGAYYRWLFFGAGCFEPALLDKMMNRPEVERKAAVGYGSYEDVAQRQEGTLAKAPISSATSSAPPTSMSARRSAWPMMFGAPGLKGEKVFDDYVARVTERPAFKRAAAANSPPA